DDAIGDKAEHAVGALVDTGFWKADLGFTLAAVNPRPFDDGDLRKGRPDRMTIQNRRTCIHPRQIDCLITDKQDLVEWNDRIPPDISATANGCAGSPYQIQ